MNAILIETSAATCSAALVSNDKIIESFRSDNAMQHAVHLPQYIEKAMRIANEKGITIDVVAVSGGPGSYTGLRIGVSTAKGLCYALGAKLVAVNTLHLIALEFIASHKEVAADAMVLPMIDARRMEVFTQSFSANATPLGEAEAKIIDEGSFAGIGKTMYLCGSGAAKCSVVKNPHVKICPDVMPAANEEMVRLAVEAYEKGRFEDVAYYEPFYLKEFYTTMPKG